MHAKRGREKSTSAKKSQKKFKRKSNKENDEVRKNGFDHRNLQVSKYAKRLCSKIFSFLKTLEDDPLLSRLNKLFNFGYSE